MQARLQENKEPGNYDRGVNYMQKTRNHAGLFLIFFIVAIIGVNILKIVDGKSSQFLLDAPKIPLLRISNDGINLTDLRGYRSDDAKSYASSTVIPLEKSKKLTVSLGPDLEKVSSLTYEIIRNKDGKLVADGTIKKFTKEEEYLTAQMTVDDDLREGTKYMIRFRLSLPRQEKIYYYAQLQYGETFYTRENMQFVQDFHKAIFEKDEEIAVQLQQQEEFDQDFFTTSIKSGTEEVLFGNAQAKVEGDISYRCKEVAQKEIRVELTYLMSIQREGRSKQYYRVEEDYDVAYDEDKDSASLMDYDRQVESIFNPEFVYSSQNQILLGIMQKDKLSYLEADDGKKLCFVQGRQLWAFNYSNNTMTEVFAFGGSNLDLRCNLNQNNIRLLNMDDDGNIDFLVYGYMARGEHEGENGISLYHYDATSCLIEEKIFINSDYKFSALNSGIKKLAYFDGKKSLYFLLNERLFFVDVENKKVEKIEDNIQEENIKVSENDRLVAIQKEKNKNNKELILWDFKKGENQKITCEEDQRIKMVGFISEDFVYGIADQSDLPENGSTFPMQQICITNKKGKKIKTYEKEGKYFLNVKISGNVIRVTLGKKKGTKYQKIPMQEYIKHQETDANNISFVRKTDTVQWRQLYIEFPSHIYLQAEGKVRKAGMLY